MKFTKIKHWPPKHRFGLFGFLLLTVVLIGVVLSRSADGDHYLTTSVVRDNFDVTVKVTGEIEAEKWEEILAPAKLRSSGVRVRNIKIQHMVPEGTVVKEGDYVASLDRSEIDNTLKDIEEEIEKVTIEYQLKKLDTASRLKAAREELKDLRFTIEETELQLDQSKYEPPATKRQLEMDMRKAEDRYSRALEEYELTSQQLETEIRKILATLSTRRRQKADLEQLIIDFEIKAPSQGMVIYTTEQHTGRKRTAGSEINPWDRTIATLPDFSSLISKTYVNEIDIGKVSIGQDVQVQVDAYPDKYYHGNVYNIANIGQASSNSGAKVFEVLVRIYDADSLIRPGMTSSNEIIIRQIENTLLVPYEAVYKNDSVHYVYKTGKIKQIVEPVIFGETHVAISQGLNENEQVVINRPDDHDEYRWATD